MSERDEFLAWFNTDWRTAEIALHGGDPEPRFRTWSDSEPVTLFGAWLDAIGPDDVRAIFVRLGDTFSEATSSEIDLIAADVSGYLAYTVHREITSTTVRDQSREYVLRVTQVYRREAGTWKVVHRHADEQPDVGRSP